jgi:hypothetical protein
VGSNPTGPAKTNRFQQKQPARGCFISWSLGGPTAGEQIDELKRRVEEQAKALGSLASNPEGSDRLEELMRRVEKPCEALGTLTIGAGEEGAEFVLNWSASFWAPPSPCMHLGKNIAKV